MGITHGESKNTAREKRNPIAKEIKINSEAQKEYLRNAIFRDGEREEKVTVRTE